MKIKPNTIRIIKKLQEIGKTEIQELCSILNLWNIGVRFIKPYPDYFIRTKENKKWFISLTEKGLNYSIGKEIEKKEKPIKRYKRNIISELGELTETELAMSKLGLGKPIINIQKLLSEIPDSELSEKENRMTPEQLKKLKTHYEMGTTIELPSEKLKPKKYIKQIHPNRAIYWLKSVKGYFSHVPLDISPNKDKGVYFTKAMHYLDKTISNVEKIALTKKESLQKEKIKILPEIKITPEIKNFLKSKLKYLISSLLSPSKLNILLEKYENVEEIQLEINNLVDTIGVKNNAE